MDHFPLLHVTDAMAGCILALSLQMMSRVVLCWYRVVLKVLLLLGMLGGSHCFRHWGGDVHVPADVQVMVESPNKSLPFVQLCGELCELVVHM